MEGIRGPYQGVWNIVRFNRQFYVSSVLIVVLLPIQAVLAHDVYSPWLFVLCFLIVVANVVSLAVSYYIYDLSDLYQLRWLDEVALPAYAHIINAHAGFDETSVLLREKFPKAELKVFDFYDPYYHTEVSIQRARKAYPPFPGTLRTSISKFPLVDHSIDAVFVILAAHEIRSNEDRTIFFKELKRILKPSGAIIVTEHLRDRYNFAAYNIGFLHFLLRATWTRTFLEAELHISREIKTTPFITTFILRHGAAS